MPPVLGACMAFSETAFITCYIGICVTDGAFRLATFVVFNGTNFMAFGQLLCLSDFQPK
jgi:hypothetical protein